jgi:hypothetical protein
VVEVEVRDRRRIDPVVSVRAEPSEDAGSASVSTRYPDCALPGFGQAGDDPMTVSLTFIY